MMMNNLEEETQKKENVERGDERESVECGGGGRTWDGKGREILLFVL